MTADLRDAILHRLDGLEADHSPMADDPDTGCCPGFCIADAVVALRAVVLMHRPDPTCLNCHVADESCSELRAIAEELDIPLDVTTDGTS